MSDKNDMIYKHNRSGILVNGVDRSGNRALLYSMGLEEEDFHKPMIGIANSFSELVPGHIHLREIAREVSDGILAAGGLPGNLTPLPCAMACAKVTVGCGILCPAGK